MKVTSLGGSARAGMLVGLFLWRQNKCMHVQNELEYERSMSMSMGMSGEKYECLSIVFAVWK